MFEMKHIIILGDGMADHAVERLGGKTLLQHANTPYMDLLARQGRCGRLITVPEGFPPGSEVANTAILGYDLNEVYEGRGPLEAASIGYEMRPHLLMRIVHAVNHCVTKHILFLLATSGFRAEIQRHGSSQLDISPVYICPIY